MGVVEQISFASTKQNYVALQPTQLAMKSSALVHRHHNHNNHHLADMNLGHLFARSTSTCNGLSWFLPPFGLHFSNYPPQSTG